MLTRNWAVRSFAESEGPITPERASTFLHMINGPELEEIILAWMCEKARDLRRSGTLAEERRQEMSRRISERSREAWAGPQGAQRRERQSRERLAAVREREKADAAREAARTAALAAITEQIDLCIQSAQVVWRKEMLESSFAMTDGSTVTWGDASVAQHEARAEMFMSNAVVNVEGAARHRQAIAEIVSSGASCLNDLTHH